MQEKKYSDAKITGSNSKGITTAYKLCGVNTEFPGECSVEVYKNGRLIATVKYAFSVVGPQLVNTVREYLADKKTPVGTLTPADMSEAFFIANKTQGACAKNDDIKAAKF